MDHHYNPDLAATQYSINNQQSGGDHITGLKLISALGNTAKQKEALEPLLGTSEPPPPENALKIKLRNAILNKAAAEAAKEKSDEDEEQDFKDIFYEYGYGVVAFFKILKTLIFIFVILTVVVALPPLLTFSSLKVNPEEIFEGVNSYFWTTLGVMGSAGTQKFIVPYYSNRMNLFCENSVIGSDPQFGIIALNET